MSLRTSDVWVLGGYQSDFARNLHREGKDFADLAGVEMLLIDEKTALPDFDRELRWNEVYYHLAPGFRG